MELVLAIPSGYFSEQDEGRLMKAVAGVNFDLGTRILAIDNAEAAALALLGAGLQAVGDVIVVCDANGIATTLTSYAVTEKEPIMLEKLASHAGFGSSTIHKSFLLWLEAWIGRDLFDKISKYILLEHTGHFGQDFDQVLLSYAQNYRDKKDDDLLWYIPIGRGSPVGLEDDEALGITADELVFTKYHMEQVLRPFRPMVAELLHRHLRDVNRKIESKRKVVTLTGSFGSSQYFYRILNDICRTQHQVQVHQEDRCEMAAARGAVLARKTGCGDVRTLQFARRSYGASVEEPFDPNLDDPADMLLHPLTGAKVTKRITWIYQKGDLVLDHLPPQLRVNSSEYFESFSFRDGEMRTSMTLVGCDEYSESPPRSVRDSRVYTLFTATVDLSDLPAVTLVKQRNDLTGQTYCRVDVVWEVKFDTVIGVELLHGGKELGAGTVDYDE
ncbi:hypothetical protein B0T19DRAFT_446867 [Cercophora scortea]|uniref:Uncharacterized protein n=1 Tax=Cercophora scortea TaxID=314031 RepID=A0AAE0I204_9PEZI|nr:hypothetical protein B0T19DRAFT_446867 [Cercophora scortea]